MSGDSAMSRFWKVYANVTDDVRHELVERAWFGRQVTSDIDAQDMPGIEDAAEVVKDAQEISNFYGNARQNETDPAALYGQPSVEPPATPSQGPEPEL